MIASWYMVMVHGLMAAGPGLEPRFIKIMGRETDEARVVNGTFHPM